MAVALEAQERNAIPLSRRLGTVTHPVAVLAGLYDRNVGVVRDVAAALPNAMLRVFARSAHFPDIEETQHYADIGLTFLQHPG